MVNSRTKGANFERDVCKKLTEFFESINHPLEFKRNLDQYQKKDQADIEFSKFAVECKCYAATKDGWYKSDWWKQVCRAAQINELTPLLVYKFNNRPIRVALPLYMINPGLDKTDFDKICVVDWDHFCDILHTYMTQNDLL